MKTLVAVVAIVLLATPGVAALYSGQGKSSTSPCVREAGDRTLCDEEHYKPACQLQREVAAALCEVELPAEAGVMIYIVEGVEGKVMVDLTIGRRTAKYEIHARVPDRATGQMRVRSLEEMQLLSKMLSRMVAAAAWLAVE